MKIVVAIDSLKGSLTSIEAGTAIKEGILNIESTTEVKIKPLADGGEGTIEALVSGMGGEIQQLKITGPIGEQVIAKYGCLGDHKTVIIEMAEAAGLTLVPAAQRNPLYTTTYGVGEVIKQCIQEGYRKFIIGIGGSATNDAGTGLLTALGFKFLDHKGNVVLQGGQGLIQIQYIETSDVMPELKECEFRVACDVSNPLYGPDGAAVIYGPQKGATPEIVAQLDEGLEHFARIVKEKLKEDFSQTPGAGAAGGLGFGLISLLKGKLEPGIQIILEETRLEEDIKEADLVITGEGRLDNQTAMGKAPIGVARLAKKYNIPVIGLAGTLGEGAKQCNREGIDAYFSIISSPMSLEEAMNKENTKENIIKTIEQILNLVKALRKK
ncbi:MAG: glycerate kinase family protein [Cellulosilyticaceae bacterium]